MSSTPSAFDQWVTTMTQNYLEAAEWADAPYNEEGTAKLDYDGWFTDAAIVKAGGDCRQFVSHVVSEHGWELLDDRMTAEQCGHDFWLTRNGHGAGFWDRGYGEAGKTLSDIARTYGEANVGLTADGDLTID